MPDSTPQPEPAAQALEDLVFQCLESGDPGAALRALEESHPALAPRVSAILDSLLRQGLWGTTAAEEGSGVPDRLGPFRLLEEIGMGGMGVVYLAEQEDLGRRVALKLIRPEQLFFPGSRERFQREVEAVARLQHPGIVPIFTVGEEAGIPYFTMEHVAGCSLAAILQAFDGRRPDQLTGADLVALLLPGGVTQDATSRVKTFDRRWPAVCLDLITQVAEALQHAHERGILHRDIKPSNILVGPDGRARLLDFGLARADNAQQLTRTTSQIGSLPYLPPEHVDDGPKIPSVQQDIYSLGVTLYEILTLSNPFLGATGEATRRAILDGKPAPLRQANPAVDWDLETVCLRAMDPDPGQRYPDAVALLGDLDNLKHHRAIDARRPSLRLRARRWAQRNPTVTAALAAGIIVVAIASLLFAVAERSARAHADRLGQLAERRAVEAAEVTAFLVDLFQHASPDRSLGEKIPIGTLLHQGAARIESELTGQPEVQARLLSTFGRVYSWLEEGEKALGFHSRAVALRSRSAGAMDQEVLAGQEAIATTLTRLGRYDEARQAIDRLLAIARDEAAPPWLLPRALAAKAALASLLGDADTADRLLGEALSAERMRRPAEPLALAGLLADRATFLRGQDRHREALGLYEQCLAIRSEHLPPRHPALITTRHQMSHCLAALGEFELALAAVDTALAQSEAIHGADHPAVARVLIDSAYVRREAGRPAEAIAHLERANGIAQEYGAFAKQFFARMLNDQAVTYMTLGHYSRAVALLEEAVAASQEAFAGDHVLPAFLLLNLGDCHAALGAMAAAEKVARDGLAMIERLDAQGRYHPRALNTLAWILSRAGQAQQAEAMQLVRRAKEIGGRWPSERWELGRAHALAALLHNLAGEGVRAEAEADRAMELFDAVRHADHRAKAITLYNQAWAALNQSDRPRAEERFQASIAMFRRMTHDEAFAEMAWPLNHYGFALLHDRPKEAIPLLSEALAIRRRDSTPASHWRLVTTINLAMAHAGASEFAAAEPLMLEAHAAIVGAQGIASAAGQASARRLASLYERWDKPEKEREFAALLR